VTIEESQRFRPSPETAGRKKYEEYEEKDHNAPGSGRHGRRVFRRSGTRA
jgi:hypothetical protein